MDSSGISERRSEQMGDSKLTPMAGTNQRNLLVRGFCEEGTERLHRGGVSGDSAQ